MPDLSRRDLLTTSAGAALLAGLPAMAFAGPTFDPAKIKVLAFDFQGSCVDYTGPLMAMGAELNLKKGLTLDWGAVASDWRDAYHNAMTPVVAHLQPYVSTDLVYRQTLDSVLEKHKVADRFGPAERDVMSTIWGQMVPWPDTIEGLTRLRRRYTLTTLSNGTMATVIRMVKANHIPFDEVLTGELAQNYKPAPEVYDLVPRMLGVARDEVLFGATHFYDLEAAKKFGFWTAWWPRPLEYGPNRQIDFQPKPYVDIYAKDLIELAGMLGAT